MKVQLTFFFFVVFLSGCAQLDTVNNPRNWLVECNKPFDSKATEFVVNLHSGNKRCEFVRTDLIEIDKAFSVYFQITPLTVNKFDDQWHSILQIHSFPDKSLGESWRCPIVSLEVKNGLLRMYNRWDDLKLSTLTNGTCAHQENSIRSIEVFKDVPIHKNTMYSIRIESLLSIKDDGFLRVLIDDTEIANITGANRFNDARSPYLKLGVYKPTSWRQGVYNIKYKYGNIVFSDYASEQVLLGGKE